MAESKPEEKKVSLTMSELQKLIDDGVAAGIATAGRAKKSKVIPEFKPGPGYVRIPSDKQIKAGAVMPEKFRPKVFSNDMPEELVEHEKTADKPLSNLHRAVYVVMKQNYRDMDFLKGDDAAPYFDAGMLRGALEERGFNRDAMENFNDSEAKFLSKRFQTIFGIDLAKVVAKRKAELKQAKV